MSNLPFLKPDKMAGVIMMKKKGDSPMEPVSEEGEPKPELLNMAEDLIRAIHAKDAKSVAMILDDMQLAGASEMEGE